jgi:ABC-type ATPase with predicted acetyltransferase domain
MKYVQYDFTKGWPIGADLFYECQNCGEAIASNKHGECKCGNVYVDIGAARAGAEDESKVRIVRNGAELAPPNLWRQ